MSRGPGVRLALGYQLRDPCGIPAILGLGACWDPWGVLWEGVGSLGPCRPWTDRRPPSTPGLQGQCSSQQPGCIPNRALCSLALV